MRDFPVDFSDDKPLDIPWPEEIADERAELEDLNDMDLAGLYREISKIRLEVVKTSKKKVDQVLPLSDEKGVRFLTTAINELRRLQPEIASLHDDVENRVKEDFIMGLFPVIDAFDRFSTSVQDVNDPRLNRWLEGIRSIYTNILMILRNNEVKEVPAHGIFNPKYQTALGTVIRNDLQPNTIVRVERRGFVRGKKLLRTPEVIISKRDDIVET